jgi:hypothetical protein
LKIRVLAVCCAGVLLAQADTLVLRNGTKVAGSWVAVDAGQISFLVDGQLRTYPRADVSTVTFGVEQAAAPAPAPNAQTAVGLVEPQLLGAVYLEAGSGTLIPLERLKAQLKSATTRWEVDNARSPTRIRSGQAITFVVKLGAGQEAGAFLLLALETTEKGSRRTKLDPVNKYTLVMIPFNAKKFGEASYSLTPTLNLAAGEYAFLLPNSNEAYCFGVD